MSDRAPVETAGPSPSEARRMADACAKFESAWRRGERPRLEESLTHAGLSPDEMLERLLSLELSIRADAGEEPSLEEYVSRFPASHGLVEAVFAELSTAGESLREDAPPGERRGTAYNLLVGVLALQNGFIDHSALIAAIQEWAADKRRRLGDILIRAGKLDDRRLQLLEALTEEHRRRHGDDVQRSLASFGSLTPVVRAVEGMGDPDLEASLGFHPSSTFTDDQFTTEHGEPGDGPERGGRAGDGGRRPRGGSWSSSRFKVVSFHDAGMLGKVFIAQDRELNRSVALKLMQENQVHHQVSRDQFVLEGMVTGALEHPGIVPVYSLGTREDGSPFYAMRFIQGPSLRDRLKQFHGASDAQPPDPTEPPVTLPRLLRHFVNACQAMAYAHSRGVLHRDLKPDHILLGPFGETLVVDWGLAMPIPRKPGEPSVADDFIKAPPGRDTALGQDGVIVGTVAYMSPEQARGEVSRMDQTSDVYALGAVLYAILTGRAPFSGGDFATMLGRARKGSFTAPREVNREIAPALEAICVKAMSHDPDGRYQSALDLARDVERWLDDEPTVAFPEPFSMRAGRWLRRHRTAAAATAVALVSSLVGLVALNVQSARANAVIRYERDDADRARAQAEANFRESVRVVQGLLLPVTSQDLPDVPGTTRLRRRVAQEAAAFLTRLQAQRPEDPELRYSAARMFRELANIKRYLGEPNDATYQQAVAMLRGALAQRSGDPTYLDCLVETLQERALAIRIEGKPRKAAPLFSEAFAVMTDLRKRHPDISAYQRTEARLSNNLAIQRLDVGDFAEAARLASAAVRIMRAFADSEAPGPTDRLEVILNEGTLGQAILGREKPMEAVELFDDAVHRADALIAIDADANSVRFLRGRALLYQAEAYRRAGRRDDAWRAADAAVGQFERLVGLSPSLHYPDLLAEALLVRVSIHRDFGRSQEARNDLDRAVEIADGLLKNFPNRPSYSALAGRALGLRGIADVEAREPSSARVRLERARQLLAVALESNPDHPENRKAKQEFDAAFKSLGAPSE